MIRNIIKVLITVHLTANLPISLAEEEKVADTQNPASKVCGSLTQTCPASGNQLEPVWKEHELSFLFPKDYMYSVSNWSIASTPFYAVILESVKARSVLEYDLEGDLKDCDVTTYVSEEKRIATQKLFPAIKVFTSRNGCLTQVYYSGINHSHNFMAVYAGESIEDAKKVLQKVKNQGAHPGANLRKLRVVVSYEH